MNCKSRTLTNNLKSIWALKLSFEKHSFVTMYHFQIKQYFKRNNKRIPDDADEIVLDTLTKEDTKYIAKSRENCNTISKL